MLRSYTAADALTIGNASCGTIAIFLCLDYLATRQSSPAVGAVHPAAAALVCDVLDGIVARTLKRRQSVLGGDLDSLADVISFGVAPAVLGYTLGLRGGWDVLCLTYLVVCGVSRLARFNVTAAALADSTTGQGEILRGHAHPDDDCHRRHVGGGVRLGVGDRRRVVGSVSSTSARGCCTLWLFYMPPAAAR